MEIPLLKNASFTIHLFNDAGHSDPDPRINRIQVIPDKPPTVELLKPPPQSTSAPGATVPVTIRAGDDYGSGSTSPGNENPIPDSSNPLPETATTEKKKEKTTQFAGFRQWTETVVKQWTDFENNTTVVRHYNLELETGAIPSRGKPS